VSNGETLTTDGPFVAVKEALGGYLFLEADDLDAAIALAARIPAPAWAGRSRSARWPRVVATLDEAFRDEWVASSPP
jgi:hypothetical protein